MQSDFMELTIILWYSLLEASIPVLIYLQFRWSTPSYIANMDGSIAPVDLVLDEERICYAYKLDNLESAIQCHSQTTSPAVPTNPSVNRLLTKKQLSKS